MPDGQASISGGLRNFSINAEDGTAMFSGTLRTTVPGPSSVTLQASTDGGQTWRDVSRQAYGGPGPGTVLFNTERLGPHVRTQVVATTPPAPVVRGRTAAATIYDEMWQDWNTPSARNVSTYEDYARAIQNTLTATAGQFVGQPITTTTTAQLQASIADATTRLAEQYNREPLQYTVRVDPSRPDEVLLSRGNESWNDGFGFGVPRSLRPRQIVEQELAAASPQDWWKDRESGLKSYFDDWLKIVTPPEPEPPRQMDLFD